MPRRRLGLAFELVLMLSLAVMPVRAAERFTSLYISEVLAGNKTGLQDEDGERSGWIELHNGGSSTMNLAGWFLTDSPTKLTQWRIPNVAVLPDKYLVVFASGKDRTNDLAHLHTGFQLTTRGGYVALVNLSTNVVSELAPAYPPLAADVSFGSVRGEPAIRGVFSRPTPGRGNITMGPGFAPGMLFSKPSGNFVEPFTVAMSTSSRDAEIRFTTDGTLPSSNSPAYTVPLLITNTAHLRARVYQEGRMPGPPASVAYLRLFTNVTEFTSTLPVIVIDTFGKNLPISERSAFARLFVHEPVNGRTSLTNAPVLTARAGFRVRGSSTLGQSQSSFAVELLDEFNDEASLPLLGLPADADWILYAPNSYDPVLLHNPFIHQLSRDMGRYSPRTRFVEVFFARGVGRLRETHYQGLYVLEEKIKIGKNRVNIDRLGANDVKPPNVTGGYLFKVDRLGPDEHGFNGAGAGLVFVEPKEQVIRLPQRAAQRRYLDGFFREFDRALHGPDWKDAALGYRAFLNVDAAIDFHVLEVLSGNVDALVLSTHLHKPREGKIVFGPHWDFDRALGSTDGRDDNPRQWNTGQFFGGAWWPRMFTDPDFWQQWVDRWQELRQNHFSLTNLSGLIDRLAGELRDAQPREYQKWGFQPRGGSYQSEIALMKRWLSDRVEFIDAQLVQPPRLRLTNDSLLFTAPTNTTVYYTLDGSDPRLAQGAISTNALVYNGPFPLKVGVRIVARGRDPLARQSGGPPISTPWSRRVEVMK